jgi:hypothetical protein
MAALDAERVTTAWDKPNKGIYFFVAVAITAAISALECTCMLVNINTTLFSWTACTGLFLLTLTAVSAFVTGLVWSDLVYFGVFAPLLNVSASGTYSYL